MKVSKLNALLGRELGTNPYGEPVFRWDWSEDLWWPSFWTGRYIEKQSPGGLYYSEREYKKQRMSLKLKNQWVITRWLAPEALQDWQQNFPGADYPSRGYRIHTDWANKPFHSPTLQDTEILIGLLREQMSGMSAKARYADMEREMDREEEKRQRTLEDAIENEFTAGLNPYPGKRGAFVSWQTGVGDSPVVKEKKSA